MEAVTSAAEVAGQIESAVTSAAEVVDQVEPVEEFALAHLQHHEKAISQRRYAAATILGRGLVVTLGVSAVLTVAGTRIALFLLIALALTYLVMRQAQAALPSAVRVKTVTAAAITTTVALGTTLILAYRVGDLRDGGLLLIGLTIVVLANAFEIWVERNRPPVRVLVVGDRSRGGELAEGVLGKTNVRWSLIGVVATRGNERRDEPRGGLNHLIRERRPDLVVLTDSGSHDTLTRLLDVPKPSFRLVSFDHFCEYAFGRVSVWSVSPMWFMSLLHAYRRPYRRATKRALDIALSVTALLLMLPLICAVTVAVRLSGRGPVVYRQVRVGEAGALFEILKFRTMADGAEANGNAIWADENDARVTRVGHLLRLYRLDELPQIWNILKGEMSIVGPRPERPEFVEQLEREVPHWSRRHLVKPGLTGWAQVSMGYTADSMSAAEKLSYDLYYVKHRALMLDLAIILRTVGVVLRGQGAR